MDDAQGAIRIGIDVGGTFTDLVAIHTDGRPWGVLKIPSTPWDPSIAVIAGIDRLIEQEGGPRVSYVGHGTTAATNAFLTKRGATTALLTTSGFEDVLEFRRMDRSGLLDPYDLQFDFPAPLVPGRWRFGVRERVGALGEVVEPLDDVEIQRVLGVVRDAGVESVAICLLWAFQFPEHEARLAAALRESLPDVFVCASHELDPTISEYERTSTTVVNAYVGPLMRRYMANFRDEVAARSLPQPRIMQSNGGLTSIDDAARRPVALLESGPAAGIAACSYLASQMGVTEALAVDMGGTSFDVALIVDGRAQQHLETEIDGYAVRVPMLDIRSIGAGGGSIAWVDAYGSLQVGPASAGASPGPACYARGGVEPTVSDANAVLGYLQTLTGGGVSLDPGLAEKAIETRIAARLGLGRVEAASGIYRMVNAHMADAMRVMASERAMNMAELTLFAYGGAGPCHASALARELEIPRTIIPPHPGTMSALGAATADLVNDVAESILLPLERVGTEDLAAVYERLHAEAIRLMAIYGVDPADMRTEPYFVARYIGQMHDLDVEVAGGVGSTLDTSKVSEQFHVRHREMYGFAVESEPIMVMAAHLRVIGRIAKPEFSAQRGQSAVEQERIVPAWFEGTGFVDCPLYVRKSWRPNDAQSGPAIIQEYDSTTVVQPGQRWYIDEFGSLVIEEDAP